MSWRRNLSKHTGVTRLEGLIHEPPGLVCPGTMRPIFRGWLGSNDCEPLAELRAPSANRKHHIRRGVPLPGGLATLDPSHPSITTSDDLISVNAAAPSYRMPWDRHQRWHGFLVLLQLFAASFFILSFSGYLSAQAEQTVAVIIGAPGSEEFGPQFHAWADRWREAVEESGNRYIEFGREPSDAVDRESIKTFVTRAKSSPHPLWLVLIGHGTHYRETSKFNLRGPDISAADLKQWLDAARCPIVVVNCASSSGPFVNTLSGENRVVITATKSGAELNFARFGDYLSAAINDPVADLDHDDRVSLLEAYLRAAAETARFYEQEGRLATEHALLDDNGDGLGTPATFYRGIRAVRSAKDGASLDGPLAARMGLKPSAGQSDFSPAQQLKLAQIEQQIASLRGRKALLSEEDYYNQLEVLMVRLARLYDKTE